MALLESSGGSEEIIFEKTSRLKSRVSVRSLTEPGATRAICCKRYGNLAVAEPMRSCYCRQLTCTSVHHVTFCYAPKLLFVKMTFLKQAMSLNNRYKLDLGAFITYSFP